MLGAKLGILDKQYNIVTDGLVVEFEPAFLNSYPGTGDSLFNIASGSLTPTGSLENNGTNLDFTPPSGNAGGYFTYDGSDDYCVTVIDGTSGGNFGSGASKEFTISFWVKVSDISVNDALFNWGTSNPASATVGVMIFAQSSQIRYYVMGVWGSSPTDTLSSDTWYHVVLTRTASDDTNRIYINGVEDTGNATTSTSTTNESSMEYIALMDGYYDNSDGDLGPFLLYNRALSAGEVLQNYNASKDRYSN